MSETALMTIEKDWPWMEESKSGRLPDKLLCCRHEKMWLHGDIVCPESKFLNRAYEDSRLIGRNDVTFSDRDLDLGVLQLAVAFMYLKDLDATFELWEDMTSRQLPIPSARSSTSSHPTTEFSVSDNETEEETALNRWGGRVFVLADLNGMAEFLGIESLVFVSKQRIQTWSSTQWSSTVFPGLLHHVFQTAANVQLNLKAVFIEVVVEHISHFEEQTFWQNFLTRLPQFADMVRAASVSVRHDTPSAEQDTPLSATINVQTQGEEMHADASGHSSDWKIDSD